MDKKLEKNRSASGEKNDIKANIDTIHELTADPRYVCEKCARVAKLKANVCKPHKFQHASYK